VEIQYSNGSVDVGHKLNGVACTVGTTHHNPRQSFGSCFAIIQTSPAGLIALDTIHVPVNNVRYVVEHFFITLQRLLLKMTM
jgi:hypothetical protein